MQTNNFNEHENALSVPVGVSPMAGLAQIQRPVVSFLFRQENCESLLKENTVSYTLMSHRCNATSIREIIKLRM